MTARTKHVDLKLHHVREVIINGTIYFVVLRSDDQRADTLTKFGTYSSPGRFVHNVKLKHHDGTGSQ